MKDGKTRLNRVFREFFLKHFEAMRGKVSALDAAGVFTALDTQQSVSNSETNTCKGVSAHVAGSTTQGTYLLS